MRGNSAKRVLLVATLLVWSAFLAHRDASAGAGDLIWEDRLFLGSHNTLEAIVARGDRVFAAGAGPFTGGAPGRGNADIFVRAYEARTGGLLWTSRWDVSGRDDRPSGLAVEGDRVFVAGSSNLNVTGRSAGGLVVRAYDADTGDVLWEDQCPGNDSRASAIGARAGRVFVTGRCDTLFVVRAYDARTGALVWSASGVGGALALEGDRLFVTGSDASGTPLLRSYEAGTGTLAWEVRGVAGAVAVEGGAVFVAGGQHVGAFDASTGTLLWQDDPGDFVLAITAGEGRVFVAGLGNHFLVRAYDAASGELLWTDQPGGIQGGGITVGGGQAFVAGFFRGTVRAYDAVGGQLRWESDFPGEASPVAWAGGRVFVGGTSPHPVPPITAFDWLLNAYDVR